MKSSQINSKISAISLFYGLAVICRFMTIYLWRSPDDNPLMSICHQLLTGIGPTIGTVAVVIIFHRKMTCSIFGSSLFKSLWCILVPVLLLLAFDRQNGYRASLIFVGCISYAFLEEVGWRGYLTSELSRLPQYKRVLFISVLWFLWHLDFSQGWSLLIFYLTLLLASWGLDQIAHDSRSLVFCASFHGIFNLFKHGNGLFDNHTTLYLLGISIASWFVIWYIPFKKGKSKKPTPSHT